MSKLVIEKIQNPQTCGDLGKPDCPGIHFIHLPTYSFTQSLRRLSPWNLALALLKSRFNERTTQRIAKTISTRAMITMIAAITGCLVANQVSETAATSSLKLKAILEKGSGEGVTAARIAVLPLCEATAINPPRAAAAIWATGERCWVAP